MPPARPIDPSLALQAELDRLQATTAASTDAEAKARLAAQDAEAARREAMSGLSAKEEERRFWEHYAAETEAGRRAAETALADAQAAARAPPPAALDRLAHAATAEAASIELDKASTRVLINEQLRLAGWAVDSATLRHAAGTRPQAGQAIPSPNGRAAAAPLISPCSSTVAQSAWSRPNARSATRCRSDLCSMVPFGNCTRMRSASNKVTIISARKASHAGRLARDCGKHGDRRSGPS